MNDQWPDRRRSDDIAEAKHDQKVDGEIKALQDQVVLLSTMISDMKKEREKALLWGIGSLGMAVLAMGGWIVTQFTGGHFKP